MKTAIEILIHYGIDEMHWTTDVKEMVLELSQQVAEANKWIDVKDVLPENSDWKRVLINNRHTILPYYYDTNTKKWFEYGRPFCTMDNITHWCNFDEPATPEK